MLLHGYSDSNRIFDASEIKDTRVCICAYIGGGVVFRSLESKPCIFTTPRMEARLITLGIAIVATK
jgi:hypothetical protein